MSGFRVGNAGSAWFGLALCRAILLTLCVISIAIARGPDPADRAGLVRQAVVLLAGLLIGSCQLAWLRRLAAGLDAGGPRTAAVAAFRASAVVLTGMAIYLLLVAPLIVSSMASAACLAASGTTR